MTSEPYIKRHRFMTMAELTEQNRRDNAFRKDMRKQLVDIPTAMLGVNYGGCHSYPDSHPFNATDYPENRVNFLRVGSAASMCADLGMPVR